MRLSKLLADLSDVMAAYPNDDPVVEFRLRAEGDIVNDNGNEIGSVSIHQMVEIGDVLFITTDETLDGVWMVSTEYERDDDS